MYQAAHMEVPVDGLYHWLAESTHQLTTDTALAGAHGPWVPASAESVVA